MASTSGSGPKGDLRVAVLLSGTGRTLENLIERTRVGELPLRFVQVISSRDGVRGNDVAATAGIPLTVLPRRAFPSIPAFSEAVWTVLDPLAPDLILMAGFLCKIDVPDRYLGRIMNIHPSLLPLFGGRGLYGDRVHAAVLASGMRVTGCTVHFVDNDYDAGPIILQRCVPVLDGDSVESLARRVFTEEREIYPEAIRLFAAGRLQVEGRRVVVLPAQPVR